MKSAAVSRRQTGLTPLESVAASKNGHSFSLKLLNSLTPVRQADVERTAFIFATFEPDVAAVPADDGLDDGHAQPHGFFPFEARPAGFGEFVEQEVLVFLRNADDIVAYRNQNGVFFFLDVNADDAVFRSKLDGVGNQVVSG